MDNCLINIKMAVISDLHVGGGSKAKDFSLDGESSGGVDNYIEQFSKFVEREGVAADYLLVPGDITNAGCKAEFELASLRIKEIAQILGVPEEKILFCPGNHDVDWVTIKALKSIGHSDEDVIKPKYLNMHASSYIFNQNLSSANGRFDESPYLVTWEFTDAVVCALNTAAYDTPDKHPHCGEVKPGQLDEIDRLLAKISKTDKLKVFIFHHHPIQYLDVTFDQPDFSAMSNAAGLLDALAKHKFDFIVHGHKHIPRFNMEIKSSGHPLNILCAGSFSASLDNKYYEAVGNHFHIVEFHDRCNSSKYARGEVKTWTHYGGPGWMSSPGKSTVDRQHNFGAFLPQAEVVSKLCALFEIAFGSATHLKWKDFLLENPEFKYYTNEMLRSSLKDVSEALNVTLHEIDEFNLDQLIILKG